MSRPTDPEEASPLLCYSHLADYLEAREEAILVSWRSHVENDDRLAVVSRLSRTEFQEDLPKLIAQMTKQLRYQESLEAEERSQQEVLSQTLGKHGEMALPGHSRRVPATDELRQLRQVGREHGLHRWQEGYDLRQVMVEWSHLTQTILRSLHEYENAHSNVPPGLMARSRLICAQILSENLVRSVDEYHRLQQAEANEVAQSLSNALKEVTRWEQQRGQVLREAVHDLRGHLTAVQGATELLDRVASRQSDSDIKDSLFGVLHRSAESLHEMLTSLMDLARLEAGKEVREIESFDAGSLLVELCETMQPLAEGKSLTLGVAGREPLLVEGDAIKVRRIAQNLIMNALQYTRDGGVEIHWLELERQTWTLRVTDTGPGFVPRPEKWRLMESTAARPQPTPQPEEDLQLDANQPVTKPGEGVGLAIVKRLCTLLDAELEVASTLGVGTTFQVTFPLSYENGSAE